MISNFKTSILGISSAILFSLNTPIYAILFQDGASSITIVLFRSFGAVILLFLSILIIFKRLPKIKLNIENLIILTLSAISTILLAFCYSKSVQFIPVGLAAIIFYIWPILLVLGLIIFYKQKMTILEGICFIIALLGLAVAVSSSIEFFSLKGMVLAFLAAIGSASNLLLLKRIYKNNKMNPFDVLFFVYLIAGIFVITYICFFDKITLPKSNSNVYLLFFISFTFFLAILSQQIIVKIGNMLIASITYNLEPVSSIIIAALLLSETLTNMQYLGGLIVILSLVSFQYIHNKAKNKA